MSLLYQAKDGGILMILRIANSYINNRRYTHKRAVIGVGVNCEGTLHESYTCYSYFIHRVEIYSLFTYTHTNVYVLCAVNDW